MMVALERSIRGLIDRGALPIARVLAALGVTADMVTVVGFIGNVYVAILIAQGRLVLAGIVMVAAGTCDALDGAVARASRKTDRSGALLDSVIDRYSESVVFLGLIVFFFTTGHLFALTCTFMAIVGAMLVSYIRARAEGLNVECRVGLMQRGERVVLLALGLMLSPWNKNGWYSPLLGDTPFLVLVLGALAVLTNVTAIHRLIFSYAELNRVHRS